MARVTVRFGQLLEPKITSSSPPLSISTTSLAVMDSSRLPIYVVGVRDEKWIQIILIIRLSYSIGYEYGIYISISLTVSPNRI